MALSCRADRALSLLDSLVTQPCSHAPLSWWVNHRGTASRAQGPGTYPWLRPWACSCAVSCSLPQGGLTCRYSTQTVKVTVS